MGSPGRLQALLARHWWRASPSWLAHLLRPLAWLYRALASVSRQPGHALPVRVVVVGNLIVGGAGKTPTVIALVQALRAAGWRPGVISRGHGRAGTDIRAVEPGSAAGDVGDEPLLMRRRTGVPVYIGRLRLGAARALCAAHPAVDVLVADDGLQHAALAGDVEIVVFDERGIGNGLLLPAGPLREAMPEPWPAQRLVLYNAARPSTAAPGSMATRALAPALLLADWQRSGVDAGTPLRELRGRPLLAVAGIAAPERFFSMLEGAGLTIARLALPDHHRYATLPWPAGTPEVITTEKDAVKLDPAVLGATRVWVAALDFVLPPSFIGEVLRRLGRPKTP